MNTVGKSGGFERQLLSAMIVPGLAGTFVMTLYSFLFAGLVGFPLAPGVLVSSLLVIAVQLVLAFLTNKFILSDVRMDLEMWELHPTTERERTRLLGRLMACPGKLAAVEMFTLLGGVLAWLLTLNWFFGFSAESLVMAAGAAIMGAYTVVVLSMTSYQKICSSYGCRLVEQGLDRREVRYRKSFGMTSETTTVIYGFLPLFLVSGVSVLTAWRSVRLGVAGGVLGLGYLFVVGFVNLLYVLLFALILSRRVANSVGKMRENLESMDRSAVQLMQAASIRGTSTDLSNSFMYNIHLVNSIISLLQGILTNSREISSQVVASSNELDAVSHDTLSVAMEQSRGIRELLAGAERVDEMAKETARKIGDVALVAHKTEADIEDGLALLDQMVNKLADIRSTNRVTVSEIKDLGERISGISDIAIIINSIADQTRLIAFNAEMEAAKAGDAGREFHLVSKEIRQLTNNTVELTKEIRNRVADIHHASFALRDDSKKSNSLVVQGESMTGQLLAGLGEIRDMAASVDDSAVEVRAITAQQTAVLEQVVATLRQIAVATDTLSSSIQTISQSSRNFACAAGRLETIEQSLDAEEVAPCE